MDIKARIETAKVRLNRAEKVKVEKETQLKGAQAQRDEIILKMAQEGVTPETIDDEIKKLEADITSGLDKIESLIPTV